ncbi:MAG: nitroreductase family deazaflavin-dependent oxidoreductase [Mycobacterium sp.]
MSTNDHSDPNRDVPVPIPPWMDRWLFRYMNPVMKRVARYLPAGASVIEHRGRTSGKRYETVVTTYRNGDLLAVGLGHGMADWVKNVLAAGEADVRLFRRKVHITNPRILPAGVTDESLPRAMRRLRRRVAILVADIT